MKKVFRKILLALLVASLFTLLVEETMTNVRLFYGLQAKARSLDLDPTPRSDPRNVWNSISDSKVWKTREDTGPISSDTFAKDSTPFIPTSTPLSTVLSTSSSSAAAGRVEVSEASMMEGENSGSLTTMETWDPANKRDLETILTAGDENSQGQGQQTGQDQGDDRRQSDHGGHDDLEDAEELKRLQNSPFIFSEKDAKRRLPLQSQPTTMKFIGAFKDASILSKSFIPCKYKMCAYTRNMSEADLVIFRGSVIRDNLVPQLPEYRRPPGQTWVMTTADPAAKEFGLQRADVGSNFNWTATYQLSADIRRSFGQLLRRSPSPRNHSYYEKLFQAKTNHTAWFVSHCRTWGQRHIYVQRMRTVMEVDVFGKCGNLSCRLVNQRDADHTLCLPMLTNQYKFYLSFENSFCQDYISEKFFKLFQDVDVIPVVRGAGQYQKYLPKGIFIDAADFETPEALARYLVKLGNDKEEYIKMLKRKDRWVFVSPEHFHCLLCEHLHTYQGGEHIIRNLHDKFNGPPDRPDCRPPTDIDTVDTPS